MINGNAIQEVKEALTDIASEIFKDEFLNWGCLTESQKAQTISEVIKLLNVDMTGYL